MSDCGRHAGLAAEEARSKCQVCTYELATYLANVYEKRHEEARQFERDVMGRCEKITEAARRDFVPERLMWAIGTALLFAAFMVAAASCSHVTRRTVETAATSTATLVATKAEAATAQATATHDTRRVVRKSRITRPLPDGGSETIDELVELYNSDGRVNAEAAKVAKVEGKATESTNTEAKLDDRKKTSDPWWKWLAIGLLVAILVGSAAWRWAKRRIGR